MLATPAAIAIDAGGSTTRALIVSHDGECGPVVLSVRGNPVSDPIRAASNIADACAAARAASPHEPQLILAAVAGIVSRDFPELSTKLRERALPGNVTVVSDLLGAYFSATAALDGSVMIVGTGAVAARIANGELVAIRDGLGWLLGDDGSGFWMGRQVARAVAAELDGRGPATSLTPRLLQRLVDTPRRRGVRSADLAALLTWTQTESPMAVAQFAILAADEATADPVASAICEQAACHALATLSSLGTDTLQTAGEPAPVVLGGSVLDPMGPVGQRVHEALHQRALTVSDGVAGAALMAVKHLGGTADEAMLAHIRRQLPPP